MYELHINQFLANVSILYPPVKHPKTFVLLVSSRGVGEGYKMGTLARNGVKTLD